MAGFCIQFPSRANTGMKGMTLYFSFLATLPPATVQITYTMNFIESSVLCDRVLFVLTPDNLHGMNLPDDISRIVVSASVILSFNTVSKSFECFILLNQRTLKMELEIIL